MPNMGLVCALVASLPAGLSFIPGAHLASVGSRCTLLPAKKGFGKSVKTPKRREKPDLSLEEEQQHTVASEASQDQIFAKYGVQPAEQTAPKKAPERPPPALIELVPKSVQIGLERFFVVGIVVLLVIFVGIGLGITVEAFAAATQRPLPEDQRHLIADILEPAFTPVLVAGFVCSISLGILKTLQLTSRDVQYSEYRE